MSILGIDEKDTISTRCKLYWAVQAGIIVQREETENIPLKRGVREGCVFSPSLSNVYILEIFLQKA